MILDQNILIGALAVVTLALVADVFFLRRKLRRMLRGEKACDVCESIATLDADVKGLEKFQSDMEEYLKTVEKRLRRATQCAETVRFDAFGGTNGTGATGGGQSFATAFVNEDGTGAVLSSLYTRERVSVFSKPVVKFGPAEVSLSEEEKRAVSLAKAKLSSR
ncbi:MAG TPA: DUF4446 family protein [Candidatus Paceibacterota bacterium]|nr:DUF4446 family protein [Candidatus Paceibacterota bacterium]